MKRKVHHESVGKKQKKDRWEMDWFEQTTVKDIFSFIGVIAVGCGGWVFSKVFNHDKRLQTIEDTKADITSVNEIDKKMSELNTNFSVFMAKASTLQDMRDMEERIINRIASRIKINAKGIKHIK